MRMLSRQLLQLAPLRVGVWHPTSRHINHSRVVATRAKPQDTSARFPYLKRGPFAELTNGDVDVFRSILPGESKVLCSSDGLDGYNTDWIGIAKGSSQLVLRPHSTKEVSAVLKYCNTRRLAIVPQGGNTGLVAGSIPAFDEIVLSTELMTDIISVDATAGILVCQAGCVLANLDDHLGELHLMMPIDLGSKGSCRIGGNVSTNAGGLRLLRYGSLHGSVLGLEAVLANGDIVDCLSTMRKDNTGYDMKQLFIGSEGTLGVVTAVSILCPVRPNSTQVAFLGCESFDMVRRILWQAKLMLSETLSAYEFLDAQSMTCNVENLGLINPLHECPFYVLVEVSGSNSHHDEEKLNSFLQVVMDKSLVLDGTLATGISKMQELWQLRERITESLLMDGYNYKYDISLPLSHYYDVVQVMRDRLQDRVTRVVAYGHVGDGNLHLNITTPQYSEEVAQLIEPFLYKYTSQCSGSISAEHGMGLMKNKYLHYSKSDAAIRLMRSMKNLMDPHGILNPYKTLPPDTE